METTANDIIKAALRAGACQKVKKANTIAALAELFFSPQGKEFCEEHNFPDIETFRSLDKDMLSELGIMVDAGGITAHNRKNITLVGRTHAELIYEGTEAKYTVVLMHGASAKIRAGSHAVVEVLNIECKVDYQTDKTAVLL